MATERLSKYDLRVLALQYLLRQATSDVKPKIFLHESGKAERPLSGFLSPAKRGNRRRLIDRAGSLTGIDEVKKDYQSIKTWLLVSLLIIIGTVTNASCSSSDDTSARPTIERIEQRGKILVGTTGDYRPLSFCEPETGEYWGFGIDMAQAIAARLEVSIEFVKTSWPTLSADVLAEPQMFDLAIGGITITDARRETMLMSDGYLANGKTILCRASEADRYQSLADIDKPEVRVMVNPGGLNEKFANENLTHATIVVHQKNEEIPTLIADGGADIMITEITEAPYYVETDSRLAAPLLSKPFTHGEIGVLMRKGQDDLLQLVNAVISEMKSDGSLRRLHEKYGLMYNY